MKKFFLCVVALAFCAAFTGCKRDSDSADMIKSTWESRTDAGNLTLHFIDESTCSITTSSGKSGMDDLNFEVLDYWPWYGPKLLSLYSSGETENPRYLVNYSDETHMILIPIRDGEEAVSDALVLTRRR